MTLSYGSVCSGIEAATVAWEPLGWRAEWYAEIEPFPSTVLARHYPDVPNLGDMTKIAGYVRAGIVAAPDVLVGGTPCQAFSVAGARAGLGDPRGQLTLSYVDLLNAIDEQRPGNECIAYWENVPGVLSDKTNAFGCFLGLLAGEDFALEPPRDRKGRLLSWPNAGYIFGPERAIAWRVLDAQYFGVAQRRRRVFVVASARTGFDPGALLFESEGVRRDNPPSRHTGQTIAGTLGARTTGGGFPGTDESLSGYVIPVTAQTLCMAHGQGGAEIRVDQSPTLTCNHEAPILAYAFAENSRGEVRLEAGDGSRTGALSTGGGKAGQGTPCVAYAHVETLPTLRAGSANGTAGHGARSGDSKDEYIVPVMHDGYRVRRLTPRECERLQSFPDDYTLVPYRGKPAADGPRYKALGNSMCVFNMRWLGQRLLLTRPTLKYTLTAT